MSRATATALVLAAALIAGQFRMPERSAVALSVTAGLLDAVCNTAFLLALRTGLLAVVSVLTSLYLAAPVLMARLVLGECAGRIQRVGLTLAVISVTLVAGGSAIA